MKEERNGSSNLAPPARGFIGEVYWFLYNFYLMRTLLLPWGPTKCTHVDPVVCALSKRVDICWYLIFFTCRFRVVDEAFVDTTPVGPETPAEVAEPSSDGEGKRPPYSLVVSALLAPFLWLLSLQHSSCTYKCIIKYIVNIVYIFISSPSTAGKTRSSLLTPSMYVLLLLNK